MTDNPEAMAAAASSFDVVLNTVSGHAPLDPLFALLKPRGTLVCVGLPEKDQKSQFFLHSAVTAERAPPPACRPPLGACGPAPRPRTAGSLVGSYLGPYADYEEMLRFSTEHGIKPMVELFPFSEINAAIAKVRDNSARYRVVVCMHM
jgi:D-arabinose 1-dehydrogenase-like Zn-dependent alcohol dehydrogenase